MWARLIFFIGLLGGLTSCKNLFTSFTDYNTDEALYFQALMDLSQYQYDKAIMNIQKTSTAFQARRSTRYLLASAYAGKCGLNAWSLMQAFANLGTARLFPFLLSQFPGKDGTHQTACQQAEEQLRRIDVNPINRDAKENFLMILSGFVKIGVVFNKTVDLNDDGIMDSGYTSTDHCTTTMVTDADVDDLIMAMAQILKSLPYVGTAFGSVPLTSLTNACSSLESVDPTYNFCNVNNVSDITIQHRKGFRTLLGADYASGIGLGNCVGDLSACACL